MKRTVGIWILSAGLAALLARLYTWLPIPLVGVVAPVNGSLWEALKLVYWPWLTACFLLREKGMNYWAGVCQGLLIMAPALAGLGALVHWGLDRPGSHLYLPVLCLGAGVLHLAKARHWPERAVGIFIMLSGLWGGALLILSAAPPNLPLFLE